jgi:hypothetical protein
LLFGGVPPTPGKRRPLREKTTQRESFNLPHSIAFGQKRRERLKFALLIPT